MLAHGFTCRLGFFSHKNTLGLSTNTLLGTEGWFLLFLRHELNAPWVLVVGRQTNNHPPHAVSYRENLRLLLRVFTCLPESKLDVVGGKKLQSKTSLQNTNPRAQMYPKGFGGQPEQVGEEAPGGMHGNWAWCVMITPFPVPFAGTVPHRGFLFNQ